MNADDLRAVANDIREKASAATPGPWADPYREESPGDEGWWIHNGKAGSAEYAIGATVTYNPHAQADAEHIAAWHPAVALAVAKGLDACATFKEEFPESTQSVAAARSGTWYTVRYARRLSRPVVIVYPDGSLKRERWPTGWPA